MAWGDGGVNGGERLETNRGDISTLLFRRKKFAFFRVSFGVSYQVKKPR